LPCNDWFVAEYGILCSAHFASLAVAGLPITVFGCAIFLQYDQWVEQYYYSPQGDRSQAAKDFLFATLPFLAL
jgi:hypothetical protein